MKHRKYQREHDTFVADLEPMFGFVFSNQRTTVDQLSEKLHYIRRIRSEPL